MDVIKAITSEYQKSDIPAFNVGDTVKVHIKIKEGSRERVQIFEGFVLKRQHGGVSETFTVRRIASGIGVEKTFPLHSPRIEKIEVVKKGRVRRAKLNYMRERTGKAAKIKAMQYSEAQLEDIMEAKAAADAEAAAEAAAEIEVAETAEDAVEIETAEVKAEEPAAEAEEAATEAEVEAEETVEEPKAEEAAAEEAAAEAEEPAAEPEVEEPKAEEEKTEE